MALIGTPRYKRLQLVKISPEESVRLDVPKDRPWLIVQSNDVRDSMDVIVCAFTSRVDEDGVERRELTTDIPIAKGTPLASELNPPLTLSNDSYIRCSQLYSARVKEVRYFGTLPLIYTSEIDRMLAKCLGILDWASPEVFSKLTAATPKKKAWPGYEPGPITKLSNKKKSKAVTRRKK